MLYGIVFRLPILLLTLSQDRLSGQDNGLECVVMRFKSCLLFARLYMKTLSPAELTVRRFRWRLCFQTPRPPFQLDFESLLSKEV